MAERRMFSKKIIDSDIFLEMPLSAQALYFHLSMRADDDGFINNAKRIQRLINSSDDDLRLLIAKQFIIPFETGVLVVTHWKIHNYIQKDRYKETIYQEEKAQLSQQKNGVYSLSILENNAMESDTVPELDTECIQNVSKMDTRLETLENSEEEQCIQNGYNLYAQSRLGKDSIDKSISPNNDIVMQYIGARKNIPLTEGEIEALKEDFGDHYEKLIDEVSNKLFSRTVAEPIKSYYAYILAVARDSGYKTVTQTTLDKEEKYKERRRGVLQAVEREAMFGYPVNERYNEWLTDAEIEKFNKLAEEQKRKKA